MIIHNKILLPYLFRGIDFSIAYVILQKSITSGKAINNMFLQNTSYLTKVMSTALLLITMQAHAAEQEATLQQILHNSITGNPEVMSYMAAKVAADERIEQAKGGYLPTIDIRASGGVEYLKESIGVSKLSPNSLHGTSVLNRYEPGINIKQSLFEGFETMNQVEKAQLESGQADLKIKETRELLAYKICAEYIRVRRFQRLLKLARDNVKKHESILGKIQTLNNSGALTVADVNQASARLDDANISVRDIEGNYETALANFIDLVNMTPYKLARVKLPMDQLPATLHKAVEHALRYNRSVILAKATVDTAKADVNVTESAYYPKVGIEVDAARRINENGEIGRADNVTALVVARWNIFNGGKDKAKNKEYRSKAVQAYYLLKKEQRSAEKEVRISWAEMRSGMRQAEALRKAVNDKRNVRDSYIAQFDIGKRSLINILDAAHEYFLVKGSLITADSTYDISALRLLAACGELTNVMVGSVDAAAAEADVKAEKMPGYEHIDADGNSDGTPDPALYQVSSHEGLGQNHNTVYESTAITSKRETISIPEYKKD